jgi:hypothetical protein
MTAIDDSELSSAVAARFYAVNGFHPMTAQDDVYASTWYISVEELACSAGIEPSEVRRLMLANRLPLPSYILSKGTQNAPYCIDVSVLTVSANVSLFEVSPFLDNYPAN